MANPVMVTCPADTWQKVAINVTAGQVKKKGKSPNIYLETYRMTNDDAPTSKDEGIPIFIGTNSEPISSSAGIDVYIMALNADGKVRVDIP